jgi:hypothetical protein
MEGAALSTPGRSEWVEIDVADLLASVLLPAHPGGDGAPPSNRDCRAKPMEEPSCSQTMTPLPRGAIDRVGCCVVGCSRLFVPVGRESSAQLANNVTTNS